MFGYSGRSTCGRVRSVAFWVARHGCLVSHVVGECTLALHGALDEGECASCGVPDRLNAGVAGTCAAAGPLVFVLLDVGIHACDEPRIEITLLTRLLYAGANLRRRRAIHRATGYHGQRAPRWRSRSSADSARTTSSAE